METRLITGLTSAIKTCKKDNYLWVGVVNHPKAKRYKYEVLWFYGAENYDIEESIENQIKSADTRFCETLQGAYAYGFDAIRNTLQEDSSVKITITDLVEEDRDKDEDW